MIRTLAATILTLCIMPMVARAEAASLAWWFLPDAVDELPHEVEEDGLGFWKEIWLRPGYDATVSPTEVLEQGLGTRWVGANPDKEGKPGRVVIVLAGRKIVDFTGEQARWGSLDDEKISWNDGSKESVVEFRRRRRGRRRSRHAAIKFGKMALPPLASRIRTEPDWGVERLDRFLNSISSAPDMTLATRDLSAVAQMGDPNGSLLNFRYGASCSMADRREIEDALASVVEPKLTCWMEQNPGEGSKLLAALMQKPRIECRARIPMKKDDCGMATVPHMATFFPQEPQINISLSRCDGELSETLLHELFHLSGIKEKPELLDKAVEESESCAAAPGQLEFENAGEGFLNDFEVETRIFLFRKIRDEAEKWGWSDGERALFLGSVCVKMGDKYCARNYFQKASDAPLSGGVSLPEGGEVSLASLAAYQLYDSISEDVPRMHQLVKYLHRDPNGTLLRRTETGVHRLHEFYVARSALEQIQANKGVCNGDTDERVLCEDLADIVKTPWFKNP